MYEKDWYYLSDILDSPRNESEWSKEKDYFYLYDNWSNKEIAYEYGRLSVYSSNILVFRAGEVNHHDKKIKQYEKMPKTWQNKPKAPIPIFKNNKVISYFYKSKIVIYNKHISQMNDYELVNYHNIYDVENMSYIKYLSIKNLMIDRNLLYEDKYDLNNFDFDKFIVT